MNIAVRSTTRTCVQDIDLDINVHVRTGAR